METMDTQNTPPTKKQLEIAGTERKCIEEIETAASEYRATVEKRRKIQEREKELKEVLIQAMASHELEKYEYIGDEEEPMLVRVTHKTKVSVRKSKNVDESEEN